MIPNTGVLVGQQASNGVQLILKSPSPQSISTSVPKAQVVVSSNSSLTQSPNTVFVQANRTQPQQVSGREMRNYLPGSFSVRYKVKCRGVGMGCKKFYSS